MPTLGVDGTLLYETNAITDYLDVTVADRTFSPSEPLLQARMYHLMAMIDRSSTHPRSAPS